MFIAVFETFYNDVKGPQTTYAKKSQSDIWSLNIYVENRHHIYLTVS